MCAILRLAASEGSLMFLRRCEQGIKLERAWKTSGSRGQWTSERRGGCQSPSGATASPELACRRGVRRDDRKAQEAAGQGPLARWKTLAGWMRRAGLGDAPRTLIEELAKIKSGDVVLPVEPR